MKVEIEDWDFWDFPQACKVCGHFDNDDPEHPTTYLDVKTKLCQNCFNQLLEEGEENE